MTLKARFFWLVVGGLTVGETPDSMMYARQVDRIPRTRLMSDVELTAEVRDSQSVYASASDFLKQGDAASARRKLAEYFASRKIPKFFFAAGEVKERIREYTHLFPNEVKKERKRGEAFVKTYGADVDWLMPGRDLRGKAHTPNTVRYIARQWEAFNLAVQFFSENENPQILGFLMTQVRDFAVDFEAGKVETGDNDVFERFYGGHRLRNWIMMHQLLLASPLYTADDQVLMLKLILLHGAKLADQSKSFNWGNHQLVGLVALYELSVMFPEFKAATVWHDQSLKLILQHLEKEIASDGFQAERSSHYHKLDVANYFLVLQLARLNGETLPPVFHERFRKMFQAMADIAMPNKRMPILQDVSDSLDVRDDRIDEEMSLGALLYGNRTFRYFARDELPASLYWYFDRAAVSRYRSLTPVSPGFTSLSLPQTGYYVMRTGWDAGARYLLIDGGLAADKPDHTHGGVLGVIGYALGEVVLPNYPVRYSDKSYKDMKNSLAKNVALVDDVLQGRDWLDNRARTGFGIWRTLPKPKVHDWISGSEFDYFAASHDGFENSGVDYSRAIVFLKPSAWLVIDDFTSASQHRNQQIWQGQFEIEATKTRVVQKSQRGFIELIPVGSKDIEIQKHQIAYASGVRFQEKADGSSEMATLVHVGKDLTTDRATASVVHAEASSTYTVNLGTSTWIVERNRGIGSRTNGERCPVTVSRYNAKALEAVFVVNGTQLRAGDLDVVLSKPASSQLVKDNRKRWVFTLFASEANAISVNDKNRSALTFDVRPGQPVVLPTR